ncbi:hypothetical protein [Psychromonas marina]|nr:hypothetical protein [Psychromonas marina]
MSNYYNFKVINEGIMQATHNATINVGNNNYDYQFITVTKTYAGGKKDSEGSTLYLEDEKGKVETVRSDFDIEIPPSTHHISLLYREDKKKELMYRFGYYVHSNDYVGYTSEDAKANTVKRMIPVNGWKATVEKWQWVMALFIALFCAWNALFSGVYFDSYGYSVFFTNMPYIIIDTPQYIAEFDYMHKSYGSAFVAFVVGFVVSKFLINLPVKHLRKKMYYAFGRDLEERLPQIFDAPAASSPLSASPTAAEQTQTDSDGFQPLV